MLLILVSWIYVFFTSYICGYAIVHSAFADSPTSRHEPLLLSLVGLSSITVLSGLFSTFAAVGSGFHLLLLLVCAAIIVNSRDALYSLRDRFRELRQADVTELIVITFLLAVVLYKSAGPITNPDSGAYHLPFIHWVEAQRATPGLANVHSRFGFDFQYLVLCAVYGLSFLYRETIHALNGYIFFSFLYLMIRDAGRLPDNRLPGMLRLVIALFVANMAFAVTSFSPDFPCAAFSILAFLIFLEKSRGGDSTGIDVNSLLICCLSIGATLFKLSAAPTLLLNIPGLVGLLRAKPRKALLALALGGLCFAPFLYRNYIISGYLVYPLHELDLFDVDWKVALETVKREKSTIFYAALGIPYGSSWPALTDLPQLWIRKLYFINRSYIPLILVFFSTVVLNLTWLTMSALRRGMTSHMLPFLYLYIGIGYWLLNGPDPRFAIGYILPFIALVFTTTFEGPIQRRFGLIRQILLILIVLSQAGGVFQLTVSKTGFGRNPQEHSGLVHQAPYPVSPTARFVDRDGHEYFKVDDTLQCWYAPIPCSVMSDQYEFRGRSIEEGFRAVATPK